MTRCRKVFLLLVFTGFILNSPISTESLPRKLSAENDIVGRSSCTSAKDKQICTDPNSELLSEVGATSKRSPEFTQPTKEEVDNGAFKHISNVIRKREVSKNTSTKPADTLLDGNFKPNTTDAEKNVTDPNRGGPIIIESFFPNGTLQSSISIDIPLVIRNPSNLTTENSPLFVLTIEETSKNSQDEEVLSDDNVNWIPKGIPRRKLGNRQTGRARIMDYHANRWITNGKPGGNKTYQCRRRLSYNENKYLQNLKQTFLKFHENFFQEQNIGACPSLGLNPDPISCHHYFACYSIKKELGGPRFFWQHFSCPPMTAFSEELRFCVSSEAANCKQ